MKKIGLYFGTFNPIHVGHQIIANHMVDYTDLNEVWLIVTPQNPFKQKNSLLPDYQRLELVRIAVENNHTLRASNIEFGLPKPSYTTNTIAYLTEKYPEYSFALIMGEDNLRTLPKWKNYEQLVQNHSIYVYPRLSEETLHENKPIQDSILQHSNIFVVEAPLMHISASFIRTALKEGHDVRYLLTEKVYNYVTEMNFYKDI